MPAILIRGGRVVDPAGGIDEIADLLVDDGRIVDRRPNLAGPGATVIDATGRIVTPGFVDLHTHLRFPGFPDKETIASGTAAAAAGGFTTVCAMANTRTVVDDVAILREVLDEVARSAVVHVRQLASVSFGLVGEQPVDFNALAGAGAVAFSDDGKPVWNETVMRDALSASRDLGRAISVHEEDPLIVGAGVANDGEPARHLGLAPWPCRGEADLVGRDIRLLSEIGGHLHVAHVSCARTVSLIEQAKRQGLAITAEATPHHLCLTDRLLEGNPETDLLPADPLTKVNPPLRDEEDRMVLVEALAEGIVDAIATDHAPHAPADKAGPFSTAAFGFTALETALPLTLDLVRAGALTLPTLVERLTSGPARVFGLDAGTLTPGAPADICVFDTDLGWDVTAESLASQGKNTPLLGTRLRGRVTHTLVNGEIVYTLKTAAQP